MNGLLDNLSAQVEITIDPKSAAMLGGSVFVGMALAIFLAWLIIGSKGHN